MRLKTLNSVFLSLIVWCATVSGIEVENSIIPVIDRFENVDNLQKPKYSQSQYTEIVEALAHLDESVRVVTYNMLCDILDQGIEESNRWPSRLPRIVAMLNEMQPDVIGAQELYTNQLGELQAHIGEEFAFYGQPSRKENNGIFYRRDRFELIDGQVWMIPEAANLTNPMQLTMVQLKDRKSGRQFAVFNTHLTFPNPDKREAQALSIAKYAKEYVEKMPVLVMGDLNTFPNRPELGTSPYLDGDYALRIIAQSALYEAREVSLLGHVGPISTFTNRTGSILPFKGEGIPGVCLDHIYVSSDITVLIHAVQAGKVGGHFPSDHMPVLIDFVINSNHSIPRSTQ